MAVGEEVIGPERAQARRLIRIVRRGRRNLFFIIVMPEAD